MAADSPELRDVFAYLYPDRATLIALVALHESGRVDCGYFTDRNKLIDEVDNLSGLANVYLSLNPLHPEVRARGNNRVVPFSKQRYCDSDVLGRRNLLVDVDPIRRRGINASDSERQAAYELLQAVIKYLGWDCLILDTGNGYALVIPVDLPTESDLPARFLAHLHAKFSTGAAKIDTSVSDAARIFRCPNTWNVKADSIPDRPRRMTTVFHLPPRVEVTAEQIEALIGEPEQPKQAPSTDYAEFEARLDAAGIVWTRQAGLDESKYDGGVAWDIVCPHKSHKRQDKTRVWFHDGTLCFNCFSDDCQHLTGKDFERLIGIATTELLDEEHLALEFLKEYAHPDGPRLRYWQGRWYVWNRYWIELHPDILRDRLYRSIKSYLKRAAANSPPDKNGKRPPVKRVTNSVLAAVETALRSLLSLDTREAPCWIDGRQGEYIAFADCILDLGAWLRSELVTYPATPAYFAPQALDYNLSQGEPTELLAMLAEQFISDEIDAIQEFCGLCFTTRVNIQKALFIIGPTRSGKGTLLNALAATIGEHNHTAKNLNNFDGPHDLQDVPGKLLLSVADHRTHNSRAVGASVQRLLSIIGGDAISVNPKNGALYTIKPVCKVTVMSNAIPEFGDKTDAMFARLLFIRTRKSFAGKEDPDLLARIIDQRPAIAWWALTGLRRLIARGCYIQPANGLADEFLDRSSPVERFAAQLQKSGRVEKVALYEAYCDWCDTRAIEPLKEAAFFRAIYATTGARPSRVRENGERLQVIEGLSLGVAS